MEKNTPELDYLQKTRSYLVSKGASEEEIAIIDSILEIVNKSVGSKSRKKKTKNEPEPKPQPKSEPEPQVQKPKRAAFSFVQKKCVSCGMTKEVHPSLAGLTDFECSDCIRGKVKSR